MADVPFNRTRLPIADPGYAGVANRTLAGSAPDWGLIGHVTPPEGAPNVLLVLIDVRDSASRARSAARSPRPP